jgi:hypothetical protein
MNIRSVYEQRASKQRVLEINLHAKYRGGASLEIRNAANRFARIAKDKGERNGRRPTANATKYLNLRAQRKSVGGVCSQ